MTAFAIEYVLKLTIVLSIPLVFVIVDRFVSADIRSRCTVAVFTIALLLPVAILIAPEFAVMSALVEPTASSIDLARSYIMPVPITSNALGIDQTSTSGSNLVSVLSILFFVITTLFFTRVIIRIIRGERLRRLLTPVDEAGIERLAHKVASQIGLKRSVDLRFQNLTSTPFVCGIFRPVVALPTGFVDWSRSKQRAALSHELAHIYRGDPAKHVFVQVTASLLWWHPLALYAAYRYRGDIEQACDDMVVRHGTQHSEYAEFLLEVAREQDPTTKKLALPMAAGNALRRRVHALINPGQRRNHMSNLHIRALALATTALLYCLGAIQVTAAQPDDRRYMPLFKVVPEYPRKAQDQRIEGYVLVEFDLNEDGKPVNIRAVEQSPADGLFEASALAATERFRYLPERQAGSDVAKKGIRNRVTFNLDTQDESTAPQVDSLDELARSSKEVRKQLSEQLYKDIESAEEDGEADQFIRLAKIALDLDPGVAEYLVVRASQIGTSNSNELRLVGGMVLHRRGAFQDAINLFTSVKTGTPEQVELAKRWVKYLEVEIARTDVVHSTLLGLTR
jgi:bla regulator protein blaR1